jgi:hypothetical protein
MFNQRVLNLGKYNADQAHSDIRKCLFFNQIFHSNMNELFQRDVCEDITPDYLNNVKVSIGYLDNVVNHLSNETTRDKFSFCLDTEDSFERRLISETRLGNQISSHYLQLSTLNSFSFLEDRLYYLTPAGQTVLVSSVDPKSPIYSEPFSYDYDGYTKYWKTDESIRSYLENIFGPTLTAKFTGDLVKIAKLGQPDLKPPKLDLESEYDNFTLDQIFKQDFMIEYPLVNFDVYLRFLYLASIQPSVEAISVCLYRIGDNPILFYLLRDAVKRGKRVTVNVETEATGETINQFWVTEMKRAGIDVLTYATGHQKVHCKVTLVEFRDGRMISQIGTGNYHWQTTSAYTDLSYLTADELTCDSVRKLFNVLRHRKKIKDVNFGDHFLVTGSNARERLTKLIREQADKHEGGYIAIKCNSLTDKILINELQSAATGGCRIELIVRGVCAWNPERLLNKNVRVRSFVWDKLEHSRVYCFGVKNPDFYLGSLDLVDRKLDRRVETLVQIRHPSSLTIMCEYLNRYILNTENSWIMVNNATDVWYVPEKGDE